MPKSPIIKRRFGKHYGKATVEKSRFGGKPSKGKTRSKLQWYEDKSGSILPRKKRKERFRWNPLPKKLTKKRTNQFYEYGIHKKKPFKTKRTRYYGIT